MRLSRPEEEQEKIQTGFHAGNRLQPWCLKEGWAGRRWSRPALCGWGHTQAIFQELSPEGRAGRVSREWRGQHGRHPPAQVGQFRSPGAEGRALGARGRWRGGRPCRTRPGYPLQPLSSDSRGRMERWATSVSLASCRGKSCVGPQDAALVLPILLLPSPTSERTTRGPGCRKSPRGLLPLVPALSKHVSGVTFQRRLIRIDVCSDFFLVPKWYHTVDITGYIHPQPGGQGVRAVLTAMLLTAKTFGTI